MTPSLLMVGVFAVGGGIGAATGMAVGYSTIISAMINFGAMGLLSAVLFYIYHQQRRDNKEQIIAQREDHRQEMRENRKSHLEAINLIMANFKERDEERQKNYNALMEDNKLFRQRTEEGFTKISDKLSEIRHSRELAHDDRYREAAAKQSEILIEEERKRSGKSPKGGA